MQCQMFIAVNSTSINFKKFFFNKFLCPRIFLRPLVYNCVHEIFVNFFFFLYFAHIYNRPSNFYAPLCT